MLFLIRFVLVLRTLDNVAEVSSHGNTTKTTLEVVELNSFKHLCHLSLDLDEASTENKLNHLSTCLKNLKVCDSCFVLFFL